MGASVARRPRVLLAARLVGQHVARFRFEQQVAGPPVVGRPRKPERLVLVRRPHARHARERRQLGLEVAREPLAIAGAEDVDPARAVIHDEARLGAGDRAVLGQAQQSTAA